MDLLEYYGDMSGTSSSINFHDLDDADEIDSLVHKVQCGSTKNFLVDFGDHDAYVAFDLFRPTVQELLETERPEQVTTRWINIWQPHHQKALIELLAKYYDFTPRMLGLMCSDPMEPPHMPNTTTSERHGEKLRRFWSKHSCGSTEIDTERGLDELSEHSSISSHDSSAGGNLYRIVDDVWHYSSIDFGRRYIALGYNSIYGHKHAETGSSGDEGIEQDQPLPHCTRVWTWLIICDDDTVITINEDPFPYYNVVHGSFEHRILCETRRNLVNVFRSLSLIQPDPVNARNPMNLLPLRHRVGNTLEETAHRSSDTPGLLFYYLYENWQNSYTLITRKESRYGTELSRLRREMFKSPKLHHIDRLDNIGKELGVLRRHYESYVRLIVRLLEPRSASDASLNNSRVVSENSEASVDAIRPQVLERDSMLGVSLSSAARVRFARLKDLIDLYALSEVEEYIKQKESLVSLNFSLLTLKESLDVERLTRITLLLTKATILFLPVSLMTAYFSVQLQNVEYTVPQYWISFGVILALSAFALVVFGVFSGSLQTGEVWRGFIKGMKMMGRSMQR